MNSPSPIDTGWLMGSSRTLCQTVTIVRCNCDVRRTLVAPRAVYTLPSTRSPSAASRPRYA